MRIRLVPAGIFSLSIYVGIAFQLCTMPAFADISFIPLRAKDGSQLIFVTGKFEPQDDFTRFSDLVRTHNPQFVTFDSSGGNPIKAMELGYLIRHHRLATVQIRNLECASACALAFLGGVHRIAMPGSIGVHKSSFSDSSQISVEEPVSAIQRLTAEIAAYIEKMGADPGLLQLALKYEANDIRYLSRSEMSQYKVITISEAATPAVSSTTVRADPGSS